MDRLFLLGEKEQFWWSVFLLWWRCRYRIPSNNTTPVLRWIPDSSKSKKAYIQYIKHLHQKRLYSCTYILYYINNLHHKQTNNHINHSIFFFRISFFWDSQVHDQLRCFWWCLPGGRSGCNRDNSRDYELYWLQFGWEPQKTSFFVWGQFFFIGTFWKSWRFGNRKLHFGAFFWKRSMVIMGFLCKSSRTGWDFHHFFPHPRPKVFWRLDRRSDRGFGNNLQGFHLRGGHLSVDGMHHLLRHFWPPSDVRPIF